MMFEQKVNRISPQGPPELYKTYQVLRPISTHTRPATCAEVDCPNFLQGWRSTFDVSTDLGKRQARYVREHSGRRFEVEDVPAPGQPLLVLVFPAGQQCFTAHRVALERTPIFRIKGGDWRGNPRGLPTVTRSPSDWMDDFATHQNELAEAIRKG